MLWTSVSLLLVEMHRKKSTSVDEWDEWDECIVAMSEYFAAKKDFFDIQKVLKNCIF